MPIESLSSGGVTGPQGAVFNPYKALTAELGKFNAATAQVCYYPRTAWPTFEGSLHSFADALKPLTGQADLPLQSFPEFANPDAEWDNKSYASFHQATADFLGAAATALDPSGYNVTAIPAWPGITVTPDNGKFAQAVLDGVQRVCPAWTAAIADGRRYRLAEANSSYLDLSAKIKDWFSVDTRNAPALAQVKESLVAVNERVRGYAGGAPDLSRPAETAKTLRELANFHAGIAQMYLWADNVQTGVTKKWV